MKIIRLKDLVTVFFSDGTSLQREMNDEEFESLVNLPEQEMKIAMIPNYQNKVEEYHEYVTLEERVNNSDILIMKGDSIYWEEVSQLSMPKELVIAILDAEDDLDEDKLEAYKNFWTLMSLNPDSRCRQNLFWFLQKYGMKISKYGLFVGYRNADYLEGPEEENIKYSKDLINFVKESYDKVKHQKQSPKKYTIELDKDCGLHYVRYKDSVEDRPYCLYTLYNYFNERNWDYDLINPSTDKVYTDHHSHTFKIKIGEKVTMPREKCDSVQENSCSRGLHIGGQTWLNENYFGDTGLICLVNPADVVAVPPIDDYGKLRTCAYLPIGTVKFDEEGKVIPYNLEDGFKSEYVKEVLYNGERSTENSATYKLEIPDIPELDTANIYDKILSIAQQSINDRVL